MMTFIGLVVTILVANPVATLLLQPCLEDDVGMAIGAVLEATSHPSCSLILFTDGVPSPSILKAVNNERSSPRGVTVMEVTADGQDANVTMELLSQMVSLARRVRRESWCVRVVMVSHDPAFLTAFAESSLKGRLMAGPNRLLVVTLLTLPELYAIMPSHWTFFMMNTVFLNLENTPTKVWYRLYTFLPYSPVGAQVVQLAIWSSIHGMFYLTSLPLFPDKFSNFYGADVNVTALPWPPFWIEEEVEAPNGTVYTKCSGSDCLTLKTVSEALNFNFKLLPVTTWTEVTLRVWDRTSLIAPLTHLYLPERLKRHDFTYAYEFIRMTFSLAKPGLKPRWQSLYYPLADKVWIAMLVVLLLMPFFLHMINVTSNQRDGKGTLSAGAVALEVTGILVGQNLPLRLPNVNSSRLLLVLWLVFALVMGSAYRGNLTAALTLPKFPPRPETIEQLVHTVDKITVPPVGNEWRKFMLASKSEVYKKFGSLMLVGPTSPEGLLMATKQNTAQMTDLRNMAGLIARHFTRADGSTPLYIGREPILPVPAAWPIPHDAPFKPHLDRNLRAIVETGLFEKWNEDTVTEIRRKSQRRQRKLLAQQPQEQQEEEGTESGSSIKALTLTHMQGPLMLLLLSLGLAGFSFIGELLLSYKNMSSSRGTNVVD